MTQVVYEMAAVEPLVESIEAAFREGFAAACVVAYESRVHKLEEVCWKNHGVCVCYNISDR